VSRTIGVVEGKRSSPNNIKTRGNGVTFPK